MQNPVIEKLVETAWTLARIQVEGVEDYVGFSNADKNFGAHLAAVVQADPLDEDNVRALASLVGVKYQRQVQGMVGADMAAKFKALARGTKLTPEMRLAARNTVLAEPNEHPQFGKRVLFSFQFNQAFGYVLKANGGKPFHGPDGWKWAVKPENIESAVAALKLNGARIVGSLDVSNIAPAKVEDRFIEARFEGRNKSRIVVSFAYNGALVDAVKAVPSRKYNKETKEWSFSSKDLALAVENFKQCGDDVDVSMLLELAKDVPQTSRPFDLDEPVIQVNTELLDRLEKKYEHQYEGVRWLCRPLTEIRRNVMGGATIRGMILGDKMGLGKTMQTEIAVKSIMDTLDSLKGEKNYTGRVLVIAPASYKLGWCREIVKYCGPESVHMIDGTGPDAIGPNPKARWNVINFDIVKDHYEALMRMGYDVLIIDEAQYIKNRESERARLVVGGNVSMPEKISPKQLAKLQAAHQRAVEAAKAKGEKAPKFKHPHKVKRLEGLCAAATFRVFPLTGTPLANKPKDLFNLLKAVGHPLGKNFKNFAMRYCDPEANGFGTVYKGASNLAELRQRIDDVYLQRFEVPGLPELTWDWTPVKVDLEAYQAVMRDYETRRKAGLLSTTESHLALLNEARMCAAIAKVGATIERAEIAIENDEKVIIFSSYAKCIEKFKKHFGDMAVVLDGSVSSALRKDGSSARQDVIDRFQNDPSVKVFIGQTIAAGVAITLTAATQVKFNDLDWVPGNLVQAAKRAHRIGQTMPVNVEFIVAAGTFDEEFMAMLEGKIDDNNDFEGTDFSLFPDLVERLNNEAPQNDEAKALWNSRAKKAA